jgi:hypothetical protein
MHMVLLKVKKANLQWKSVLSEIDSIFFTAEEIIELKVVAMECIQYN